MDEDPEVQERSEWADWHMNRFAKTLASAKEAHHDAMIRYLASIELLSTISHFVGHVAHGVGLLTMDEGVLNLKLSRIDLGGNLGKTIANAGVRAGDETAAFLESLLQPYQSDSGLPGNISVVAERYAGSAPWVDVDRLSQHDFDYRVIVPFPE